MLVSEIMSTPVVTATADEPVATAATRMREQGVGSVVVSCPPAPPASSEAWASSTSCVPVTQTTAVICAMKSRAETRMYASRRRGKDGLRFGTKIAVMIAHAMNVAATTTRTVLPRVVIPERSIRADATTLPRADRRYTSHLK